jgi:hypothetical protein
MFVFSKKKCISFHYLVNIRKTTLYIGSFFLNAVWLFVYVAIYSKKDDYDAYSQGCAFSKARLISYVMIWCTICAYWFIRMPVALFITWFLSWFCVKLMLTDVIISLICSTICATVANLINLCCKMHYSIFDVQNNCSR